MLPRLFLFVALATTTGSFAADFEPAAAINQVGLDVFRQLANDRPGQNLMVAPYSIQSALALAYAGADGTTRDEMSAVLHLPFDDKPVRQAFAELRSTLARISSDTAKVATTRRRNGGTAYTILGGKKVELEGEPAVGITWHEANRLFAEASYPFRAPFLTLMRDGYAAPLEALDFRHNAEKARVTINDWTEQQTKGKIRGLIPHGKVSADTRLVLVNALYLHAPWERPFVKEFTKPKPFHFADGVTRDVPTMATQSSLGYEHARGLTVVSLDYLGGELRCLFLLPDEGQSLDETVATLKPADFARWAKLGGQNRSTLIALHLPRFRIEGSTLGLGVALQRLGLKSAFDKPVGSANFNRMAPRLPDDYLKFSEVFHQTFIALDEEGTEAAAATAVAAGYAAGGGPPPKPLEVRIDRPFLFAIQLRASGTCLFLGRVTDPR